MRALNAVRGLAVSLQVNPSVSEQWYTHAQAAVAQHGALLQKPPRASSTFERRSTIALDDQEPSLGSEMAVTG